jgi:hypothetical protein
VGRVATEARVKLLALLTLVATPAFADVGVTEPTRKWYENAPRTFESPQRFALEIKFSPYTPHIDDSPGLNGQTPFLDLFSSQTSARRSLGPRLLTQLEFDYQFLHKVGSLAVGVSLGFYRRSTHSFQFPNNDPTASCDVPNCVRAGDETDLNVIPIEALLIYRFDLLAQRYKIPLVPYFKFGLAYYIWVIQNGSGGVATAMDPNGNKLDGAGGTWGFTLQPGLAFQLDIIDQSAARTMDAELGINHTYVFVELHYADISNFHSSHAMVLSDTTFNAGIAFEF